MKDSAQSRRTARDRRHSRVRKKVSGTPDRPRLSVYRSLKNVSAQLIDDTAGKTLVAASSLAASVREGLERTSNVEAAKVVGRVLGEKASQAGIRQAVLDRGGNLYHGRVQAVADAARAAGLDLGPAREAKNKGRRPEPVEEAPKKGGRSKSKKQKKSE